ncbi:hypothetical protein ABBQ32_001201 [Trebouxia sp. C0010 RCD-2024]
MGYFGTVTLYGSLLALGYVFALFKRGNKLLKNGVVLQGIMPALKPLYARAALSMLLRPTTLPASFLSRPLPSLSITSKGVVADVKTLTGYRKLCGLPDCSMLTLVYPTVESFCMNLACMCMPSFPISVIGGVLCRYTATMHKPIQQSELLTYRQRLHPTVCQTSKGDTEFDMSVTVLAASGETLWEDTSTFLSFGTQKRAPRKHGDEGDVQPHWDHYATWQMTTQAGPQFAALNGDINLIHLHPITARLFGFKSNIAHGTYLVSKAVAAMQHGAELLYPQTVSALFKRPAILPDTFQCSWQQASSGGSRFIICSSSTGKAAITGEYAHGKAAVAKI